MYSWDGYQSLGQRFCQPNLQESRWTKDRTSYMNTRRDIVSGIEQPLLSLVLCLHMYKIVSSIITVIRICDTNTPSLYISCDYGLFWMWVSSQGLMWPGCNGKCRRGGLRDLGLSTECFCDGCAEKVWEGVGAFLFRGWNFHVVITYYQTIVSSLTHLSSKSTPLTPED